MSLSTFVGRALLRKELRRSAFISTIVNVSEPGFATKRRRRPKEGSSKYASLNEIEPKIDHGGISQPFNLSEDTIDDYLNKASLSHWVPVPDPVARKMLELAATGSDDIHIELGCGDGRVNFHAINPPFSVKRSIGVDIDENLVSDAEARLSKRHPKPNVSFRVEDLMDPSASIWKDIPEADIITMYFVEEALAKIRPRLDESLRGTQCKVVTCGYPMPDWEARWVETILGLPVFLYEMDRLNFEEPRALTDEERELALREAQQVPHSEGIPFLKQPHEDVERIEVPLVDESEKVDFHWDDFDQDPPDDLDGNPAISQWRKPE